MSVRFCFTVGSTQYIRISITVWNKFLFVLRYRIPMPFTVHMGKHICVDLLQLLFLFVFVTWVPNHISVQQSNPEKIQPF